MLNIRSLLTTGLTLIKVDRLEWTSLIGHLFSPNCTPRTFELIHLTRSHRHVKMPFLHHVALHFVPRWDRRRLLLTASDLGDLLA